MTNTWTEHVKRGFRFLGLEVKRYQPGSAYIPTADPNAKRTSIELFGPSCSGKNFIVESLNESIRRDWLFRSDLDKIELRESGALVDNRGYEQLLLGAIETSISRKKEIQLQIRFIRYLAQVISNDLKAQHGDRSVVLDEGIFQLFTKELLALPDENFRRVTGSRNIVFLSVHDARVVVKQIRKRIHETGHTNRQHAGKTDAQLKQTVDRNIALSQELMCRAESFGVPVLRLFAENGAEHNSQALSNFMKEVKIQKTRRHH